MSFRGKLMLAMAPLVVALVLVGIVSAVITRAQARQPVQIWQENYRSVLAAQRMKEAVERLYDGVQLALADAAPAPALADEQVKVFERELAVEVRNITEPGEAEAAAHLRGAWQAYQEARARFHAASGPQERRESLFPEVTRTFHEVRRTVEAILEINQDAMALKGQRTEQRAARFERVLILAVVLASVLGLLLSVRLITRLLRPLGVVSAAVRRFGQGDLQARARVDGEDDIARLAREFNIMADYLERYRRSSLGDLLRAHQAGQAAIDSLPDPVLMLDNSGALLGTNESARTLLAIASHPSAAPTLDRLDPAIRSQVDRLRAHVLGGRGAYSPKGFEDSLRVGTAGTERIYLPRATPIYGEFGSITGAALVLQDITRLFRFDELKSNLVATVAHEFRTPLTSLRMAIHLCTEETVGPLSPGQADLLFAAREDCERLQTIVDDLLNLSRMESGRIDLQRRRVDAQTLVDVAIDVHRAAAQAQRITPRAEVFPGLAEAFADPDRLQLVFANLITNAIRYSPPDGELVVRVLPMPEGPDSPTPGNGAVLRFEVSDQGPGIPVEHQASLFEKFYRVPGTSSGGAGLGLFIARGIVQAHGGRIGVDSQPGQGATFWFTIPVAPERPSQA